MGKRIYLTLGFLFFCIGGVMAQSTSSGNKVVQEAFVPYDTQPKSSIRTSGGAPAPDYWQNEVNYDIDATLLPEKHRLKATITIDYTNNSPNPLNFVWVQLEQNLFDLGSRGDKTTPPWGSRFGNPKDFDGGYTIKNVTVKQNGASYQPEKRIVDTNMKLDLEDALQAEGGNLQITIEYEYSIPGYGSDRMGRKEFNKGWVYELAQWYPRMAVYDDLKGWNVTPYLGAGEFYLDYGDFDLEVTAPTDHIVMTSGKLLNPEEVLTETVRERLDKARESDETVTIIGKDEVGTKKVRPKTEGTLTWHFKLENARDLAFGSSPAFIWDAAKIDLPSGKKSLAMSLYPEESAGDSAWGRSTEYTKFSVEFYSRKLSEYPYPSAVNIAGIVRGMEYPGVSFCSWKSTGRGLWGVTNHEFGHNWFPMIVGSNERQWAWMDEGFNSFINQWATKAFNNGEYYRDRNEARALTNFINSPRNESIMTYADQIQRGNLGAVAYFKPAVGLRILRNQILGEERFDEAFKTYVDRWSYKHPTPDDFFNTMEDVAGEELDWFWRGWFDKAWKFDQAVDSVNYVKQDPAKGAYIHISNNDKMVFPVELQVIETDGDSGRVSLPVEVWHREDQWTLKYDSDSKLEKIVVDPDRVYPDVRQRNNIWMKQEKKSKQPESESNED